MTPEEHFNKVLNKFFRNAAIRTIGFGVAKEISDSHCTVERDGQPELHEVRFHATEEATASRITEIPKEGSTVIYGIIDNQVTEAVVLKCSEVSKVLVKVEQSEFEINADGHLIKKGTDTASKLLSDLIDEIVKIIVVHGRGPNIAALGEIKERVNQLLR